MKLNNKLREQFLDAVEGALPPVLKFDFESWAAKYKVLLESDTPDDVRAFHAAHPGALLMTQEAIGISEQIKRHRGRYKENVARRVYLKASAIYFGVTRSSVEIDELRTAAIAEFSKVLEAEEERYELLNRLKEVVDGCKTDQELREVLPDLAHLIPVPVKPAPLPVVQRSAVITDLVNAGMKVPNVKHQ